MNLLFRKKFVQYLANGIPVEISEEDIPIFYKRLDEFINTANNEFESFYIKDEERLFISDKMYDYLTVSYEDSKIVFRTTEQTSIPALLNEHMIRKKMAEAFIGVILFVETIAPSEDSNIIDRIYRDKWL